MNKNECSEIISQWISNMVEKAEELWFVVCISAVVRPRWWAHWHSNYSMEWRWMEYVDIAWYKEFINQELRRNVLDTKAQDE